MQVACWMCMLATRAPAFISASVQVSLQVPCNGFSGSSSSISGRVLTRNKVQSKHYVQS